MKRKVAFLDVFHRNHLIHFIPGVVVRPVGDGASYFTLWPGRRR
jgi:hypothetical protein